MSTTPLEIVVTGNSSGAKSEMQTVSAQLGEVAVAAQKTDSSLAVVSNAFTDLANKGTKSIFILTEKLRELESAVFTEKDVLKVAAFNAEIEVTQKEIAKLANAGKSGFDDLGNSIKKAGVIGNTSFNNLSSAAAKSTSAVEKTGLSLTKAYSGLRLIANILPGIGIAGIFGIALTVVSQLADQLFSLGSNPKTFNPFLSVEADAKAMKEAADAAAKKEAEFTAAVDKASQSVIAQGGKLLDLKDILVSTSTEIKNLTAATVNQGLASFFFSEKNVAVQKLLTDQIKQQIDIRKKQNPLASVPEFNQNTFSKDPFVAQLETDKTKIKEINTLASDLGSAFEKLFDSSHKEKKQKSPFEDELIQLQKDFEQVQKLRVKTLDADLSDSTKNGIVVNETLLRDQIDFLNKKEALLNKYNKSDFENFKTLEIAKKKLLNETLGFISSQVIPNIKDTDLPDFSKLSKEKINPKVTLQFSDETLKQITAFQKLQQALKDTADIANKVLAPAFDAFFTSILNGSGNAFQALGNALNQIVKQLAVTVLKAIALGAILAAITGKTFNIGNIVGNAIKGFAGGVQNFEGGLAVVGERGPELVNLPRGSNVIPNNQIAGSMNSPQIFVPSITVRGQDLLIVLQRAQQSASRNG